MKKDPESTCSNPTTYFLYYLFQKLKMLNFFPSWLFPKPKDVVVANPMSDSNAPQTKHDVFVSFRGEDIRDNFFSHLVAAFDRKKIKPSVDYKLERGEEIWSSLAEAIEESSISLIIFSKNYATSRWCLKELVHILECRKKCGRTAIPVFYRVDPSDVRHQTGSYENAFAEHGKKYNSTMVQSWRDALNESAGLLGITSSDCRNDAELIEEIVSRVWRELSPSNNSVNSNGLFGIEKQIEAMESLLNKRLEGTPFIGIWGIGGIGKTTIAEEIFNKRRSLYDGGCFLRNVREESTRHGKDFLKEKLFSKLLGGEKVELDTPNGLPDHVKRRVKHMKVLIVLDDVNHSDQLEILVGDGDWFRSGSTVIITTRNKQVVPAKDDYIHEVGKLDFDDALDLFNLNAFKHSPHKMEEYCELSKKVVNYAKGIPLVLKVLGCFLRGKNKESWKSQLNELEKTPPKDVYDSLILSYKDLDRKAQNIFLDLACFLVGLNLNAEYIKSLLKEGENDDSVAIGLERLKDRALITFSEDDGVSVHDIIQEMAWEIVFRECPEDPGRRSRLWDPDDIYKVLKNDKGSEAIKSIKVPLTVVSKLKLSPHIFAKMSRLQFLHLFRKYGEPVEMDLLLPQGLQSLPTELRYLVWTDYPLKSLPENFSAEKLVILNLSGSKVEKLWQGVQNLVNLKEVQLHKSYFLKELPDFSKATNLELLNASGCARLTNVHPSIFSLEKLDKLDLSFCKSLSRLPTEIYISSLSYLMLEYSPDISRFSVTISENMIGLSLALTRVIALATSFGGQSKLEHLILNNCYYIESLPSCLNRCTKLRELLLLNCKELKTLPDLPSSLESLDAGNCTSLETISFPSIVEQFRENRKRVDFWNCSKLDEHSLVAIGLNAQIHMMKFACKHLPAAHDDSFDDTFEADYVYPGSSVPEWFVYKTTEDYIVIDLSAPNSPILGFIFCFVLGKFPSSAVFKISTICDDEGEGIGDSFDLIQRETNIDHVCVMYNQRWSRYLISRARNLRRLKIKVAIKGILSSYPDVEPTMRIRGCGVYPINTLDLTLMDLTIQSI